MPNLEIKTGPRLFGQRPVVCKFWRKFLCFPPFFERNKKNLPFYLFHASFFLPIPQTFRNKQSVILGACAHQCQMTAPRQTTGIMGIMGNYG